MHVFVIAGEASGDKLGAALMEGLAQLAPQCSFSGIGGERMCARGLQSLFPMDEISIMGIGEILREYRHLKARIRQTAEEIITQRPDLVVTIDLPEFSLRVARLVKARAPEIRIVHYVAPTVWAWRPGRARKMVGKVDQVLALLPFEPEYMARAGIDCDFVGHPVVSDKIASQPEAQQFRVSPGITGQVVLILPGSRRSELSRLLPSFREVSARLHHERPNLRQVIPAASGFARMLRSEVADWVSKPLVLDPASDPDGAQKRAAFRAADVALAASGTVSLELAANGTPMVIAYDMSWISRQIIGRMLLVDSVTLVNLVSETRTVPEFIGKDCLPEPIAHAVLDVLNDPDEQRAAMELTMSRLGRGGEAPGLRAARAVLDGLKK